MKTTYLGILILNSLFFLQSFANNNNLVNRSSKIYNCSSIYLSDKNQITGKFDKYNTPTVVAFKFTPETLDKIKILYHQLQVPTIVQNIIQRQDHDSNRLIEETKGYFKWTPSESSFITVNPAYTKASKIIHALNFKQIPTLKNQNYGIGLITWFVHPEIKNLVNSNNKSPIKLYNSSIASLEKKGEKYLVSILDLDFSDLAFLKELKIFSLAYLKENFFVSTKDDNIRLDFHFPYAIETATLHLHVKVNVPSHPLELSKSFSIDEIIKYLEAGKTVKQLILDRQQQQGTFYFSKESKIILEKISGYSLKEVNNPFRK